MQYWLRKCTSEYNRKIGSTAPGYSYYVQGFQTQNDVFEVLTHFQKLISCNANLILNIGFVKNLISLLFQQATVRFVSFIK